METIYLDTCALNRLTDDLSQPRVFAEANAVEQTLREVLSGSVRWMTSIAVRSELLANTDRERREQMLPLLDFSHQELRLNPADYVRALTWKAAGLHGFDALHLALCERVGIDVLLTVDDRFQRRAARVRDLATPVRVLNPVDWIAGKTV